MVSPDLKLHALDDFCNARLFASIAIDVADATFVDGLLR